MHFPTASGLKELEVEQGEMLFVLGPNGSGKSSIMLHFFRLNQTRAIKISAYRQNWMQTDLPDMTLSAADAINNHLNQQEASDESRYRDSVAGQRPALTLSNLANRENERSRIIAKLYDENSEDFLRNYANNSSSPVSVINDLFYSCNLNIKIEISSTGWFTATKNGTASYSIAKLSDGERSALLLASDVLSAKPDSLILIDEPERHLHRSIIGPLLIQLFNRRPDCGFVISTHDPDLPMLVEGAKTLLVRSYNTSFWDADLISSDQDVNDDLKRDLLGARRKVLFVEGTESSLDRPLYNLLFPEVSVIPKGDCREVEKAVSGVRSTQKINWLSAFGIVDSDGFDQHEIEKKREKCVYAVPFYSVEAIYYHPEIIKKIAERNAQVRGGNAEEMAQSAIDAAIDAVRTQVERLTRIGAKKTIRKIILDRIPDDDKLMENKEFIIKYDPVSIHENKIQQVNNAIESEDWLNVLVQCKIRSSDARGAIIRVLKYTDYVSYEASVIKLIKDCRDTRHFVRELFSDLFVKLSQDASGV